MNGGVWIGCSSLGTFYNMCIYLCMYTGTECIEVMCVKGCACWM